MRVLTGERGERDEAGTFGLGLWHARLRTSGAADIGDRPPRVVQMGLHRGTNNMLYGEHLRDHERGSVMHNLDSLRVSIGEGGERDEEDR